VRARQHKSSAHLSKCRPRRACGRRREQTREAEPVARWSEGRVGVCRAETLRSGWCPSPGQRQEVRRCLVGTALHGLGRPSPAMGHGRERKRHRIAGMSPVLVRHPVWHASGLGQRGGGWSVLFSAYIEPDRKLPGFDVRATARVTGTDRRRDGSHSPRSRVACSQPSTTWSRAGPERG